MTIVIPGMRIDVERLRKLAFMGDERTDLERELRVSLQNAVVAIRALARGEAKVEL
jgi:hypothetical protein